MYALPISYICKELGVAMPTSGGLAFWIPEVLGPIAGTYSALFLYLIYCVDSSVYPVLAGQYVAAQHSEQLGRIVSVIIVFAVLGVKIFGILFVSRMATVLTVISLVPTLLYILLALPELGPSDADAFAVRAKDTYGSTDFVLLFSWGIWVNSGYMSLGVLAGEVHNPARTFPRAIAILIPLVTALNILPVVVSLGIDSNRSNYYAGQFDELAADVGGSWMRSLFFIGALACMTGLHSSQAMTAEHALGTLAKSLVPEYVAFD